jgi:FkbM family methyltransferase
MIRKTVKYLLSKAGYTIVHQKVYAKIVSHHNQSMEAALSRLKSHFEFQTIIDIGAAKGKWSERASVYWPTSGKFLFEPLEEQMDGARQTLSKDTRATFILGVAGEENRKIDFNVSEDLDGSGIYNKSNNSIQVDMYKLDNYVDEFRSPCLLKLDTHGYEIPIFEGGQQTLQMTDALVVEVYGFYVSPTGHLFHDISGYLLDKGFRLFDIVDVMRRAKDNAFWQADAVYLRKDHPVFSNNQYL